MGRVHVDDVAGHEPVEQHADGSQVLSDRGWGETALQILNEGGDVEGLCVGELVQGSARTTRQSGASHSGRVCGCGCC
jgi:hypothetical protein